MEDIRRTRRRGRYKGHDYVVTLYTRTDGRMTTVEDIEIEGFPSISRSDGRLQGDTPDLAFAAAERWIAEWLDKR
ncbi:hypothetical protein [[Pseudomonas] boreopolis]|uniref:Uncharacterized protein n=1 Tax=Xanthomonas boreopolis TaxID=86183 RepID=A0A919F7C8_9XANT|nr:hypothetical protein GCM10009090_16170 [[Pseudomonas] boreopolis]